ncbi:MAG: DNA polymerase III subunit gamma/tau [Thermovirgaceae bacterium]|nr:DNA polymerase III subunit gamma/tau [Thermovirgaceae bacterium]
MHLSLYRRHRPRIFSEMVAQEAAVALLRREIGKGKNSHAYLFSGPRGCGKTTLARIVAKGLNCPNRGEDGEPCDACPSCVSIASGDNLDVVEIDGASNNGVDEIRELKEHISLSPFSGKFKVYIIDEVHMLSASAFNALLKTLEEPPHTVVFILATTEPHKVPATIRSRCQHIPFHRIPVGAIVECLDKVSAQEGSAFEKDALWEIARESDGSLRDALSLLEQAISTGLPTFSLEDMRGILGGGGRSDLEKLVAPLRDGSSEALVRLEMLLERGLNAERLLEGMFLLFRDILVAVRWGEDGISALPLSDSEKEFIRKESGQWKEADLWRVLEFCTKTLPRARFGLKSEIAFGMFLGLFSTVSVKEGALPSPREIDAVKEAARENVPQKRRDQQPEPQAGKSASRGEEKKTNDWAECVEAMSADNLLLYCACISTMAANDGDMVSIVFPEKFRYSFNIAASPRNLACLDSIRENNFPGMKMRIVCGERTVTIAPVENGQTPALPRPPEAENIDRASQDSFAPPEMKARQHAVKAPNEKAAVEEPKESFSEIQRCFNADLLVLKDENPDGADLPEGATCE